MSTAATVNSFDPDDMTTWRVEDFAARQAQAVQELDRMKEAASYARIQRRIASTLAFVQGDRVRDIDVLQSIADSLARLADALGAAP